MAEFPGFGKQCSVQECHMLDFLPIKCDKCGKILCCKHITYESHQCLFDDRTNTQVPVCPLCLQPVPTGKNELPDLKVNEHIDRECRSDPAKKNKKQELQCSIISCKKRELVPIRCSACKRNFCLNHRHESEHSCKGSNENSLLRKFKKQTSVSSITNSTENDEELAKALHSAINENHAFSLQNKDHRLPPLELSSSSRFKKCEIS